MNTLKIIAAVTIITGTVALAFGTGAFSAVGTDRLAGVGVSSDDAALLSVGIEDRTVDNNQEFALVTIQNRFDRDLDTIDVRVVDDGGFNHVEIVDTPEPLSAGAHGDITARVVFGPHSAGTIEIEIHARGGSDSVEMTRGIFVQRSGPVLCTIDGDHRIGESSFIQDDELFECTIQIDAEGPYEVDLDESNVTGGFIFTSDHPLHGFGLDESEIGDDVEITVNSNLVDDLEVDEVTIGGDLIVNIDGNTDADIEIEESKIGGDLIINIDGNANADIEIEESQIDGDLIININRLSSDLEIEENHIVGDLTIDIGQQTGGGSVTVEGNDVDGEESINA